MRELEGRTVTTAKATTIAFGLVVSLIVLCMFPIAAHAEESPNNLEPPAEQVGPPVESPGSPTATTPTDNANIVWVWSAPAGGLNPNYSEESPENSTDIVQYGYDLSNGETSVKSGVVGSETLTTTTGVPGNGTYTFKLWSITRAGDFSPVVTGTITIFIPLPDLPPLEVPAPIDTTPIANIPSTTSATATSPNTISSTDINISAPTFERSSVLSATDQDNPVRVVDTAAAVKPSSQGWVIVGLPWYIWLVVAAVVFVAWRWIAKLVKARS